MTKPVGGSSNYNPASAATNPQQESWQRAAVGDTVRIFNDQSHLQPKPHVPYSTISPSEIRSDLSSFVDDGS
jgi:hypothetical protein